MYSVTEEILWMKNKTYTNKDELLSTLIWCLKIFLGVCAHGSYLPNFNFVRVNPRIWQRNCKIVKSNFLDTNFQNIPDIVLSVIRSRN